MLQRRDRVLTQRASTTLVLLDLDEGSYFALDGVGERVWDLADGTRTTEGIVEVICDEYEADPRVVQADVANVVGELLEEGLFVEAP